MTRLESLRESSRTPIWLLVAAVVGGCLLFIVAFTRWGTPSDEFAYWLAAQRLVAGQPLYDPTAQPGTPYAYFYPPPLAQILAPFTLFIPDWLYVVLWTVLLLGCLLWVAGGRALVALALVAYIPVAVELWYRNIHLVLVVLIVLGLRRSSAWLAVGAAIKGGPALGLVYFVVARRYRDALVMGSVGLALLVISVALSPDAWRQFIDVVVSGAPGVGASILPVPFAVRFAVAIALAVGGGLVARRAERAAAQLDDAPPGTTMALSRDVRVAESIFVLAIVLANPTLWVTSLSMLIAIVPLWRRRQ